MDWLEEELKSTHGRSVGCKVNAGLWTEGQGGPQSDEAEGS